MTRAKKKKTPPKTPRRIDRTRIIAVANQKGGVGKTTSTANLAHALMKSGKRTLMIDLDPQASLTISFNQDPRSLSRSKETIHHVLLGETPFEKAILELEDELHLVPSCIHLAGAERSLVTDHSSGSILKDHLEDLVSLARYDFILIDCPPTLSLLTTNALIASDSVLIPVKTDYLSIMGVPLLLETVQRLQLRGNPALRILGILPTMFNSRNSHDKEALEELRESLGGDITVFEAINRSTGFDKAAAEGAPTLSILPHTPGVQNYQHLGDNIIQHYA